MIKSRIIFIFIIILLINCSNDKTTKRDNKNEVFNFYEIINGTYAKLLDSEGVPLILYEHPLNIGYFEDDSLLCLYDINYIIDSFDSSYEIDTNFYWDYNKLKNFKTLTTNQSKLASDEGIDYFRANIGKAFVVISTPIFNKKGDKLVFKEYKIYDFQGFADSWVKRYLLMKKDENDNWTFDKFYLP